MAKGRKRTQKKQKRRNAGGRSQVERIRFPQGIPRFMEVTLLYAQYNTFTTAAGAIALQNFRGNSLFDPDKTGTGTQPMYFDQWATLYNRYRVLGSRIEVIAIPTGGGVGAIADVILYPGDQETADSSIYTMMQRPRAKMINLNVNTGVGSRKMSASMRTAKLYGVPEVQVRTDDSYASTTAASPSSVWYWNTAVQESGGGATALTVTIEYRIWYRALFYDPLLNVGASLTKVPKRVIVPPIEEFVLVPKSMQNLQGRELSPVKRTG